MLKYKDLLKTKEYWMVKIQSDLYAKLEDYMSDNNLSRSDFAEELNVTKGYITQILNGDFDHKLSKLVELSLAIDKVPDLSFVKLEEFLSKKDIKEGAKYSKLNPTLVSLTSNGKAHISDLPLKPEYSPNPIKLTVGDYMS